MKRTNAALALLLLGSCIDERTGSVSIASDPTLAGIDFVERGDDLRMVASTRCFVQTYSEGTVHIDGASVDVTIDGATTTYDDPDIVAQAFPIEGKATFLDSTPISYEIPSPITDFDKLEARCVAAGRSMTVTTRFYATQDDRKGSEDPPLITDTFTLPLVTAVDPEPPNVFGSPFSIQRFSTGAVELAPALVAPGEDDGILFALEVAPGEIFPGEPATATFNVYRGDADSFDLVSETTGDFAELPRIAQRPDGGVLLGARAAFSGAPQVTLRTTATGMPSLMATIDVAPGSVPEYDALRVGAIGRSLTGYHVVIQSGFDMTAIDGSTIEAPEGKYYGSFIYEIAEDLTLLSATASDRDVLVLDTQLDGTTLLASTELPPRTEGTMLHVERTDAAGAIVWSHDEPILVYAVEVRSLPDGGALVAYETQSPSGRVELLRLSGDDGSVVYRYAAVGSTPSVAAEEDGSAFFGFAGTDPAFEDLPSRLVPLVVELSPSGEPLRAAQIGCGGWGKVANAADGSAVLLGGFAERMTLGKEFREVLPGQVTILGIE